MAILTSTAKIDLSSDVLELAAGRSASLGLSLNDYIIRLVIADALRANASTIHVSEDELSRLIEGGENPSAVSSHIKAAALNLDQNGF